MNIEIKKIKVGRIKTNCYLVYCDGSLAIVDPGGDFEKIDKEIKSGEAPKDGMILLTHWHYDHLLALNSLHAAYPDYKIVAGLSELDNLRDVSIQGLYTGFEVFPIPDPDILALDCETLKFGDGQIEVIYTPGHSAGSVSYRIEDNLFTGDTLFYHIYGRTDLISSSQEQMEKSLIKIFKIKENLHVFPGHGRETMLDDERKYFRKHANDMGLEI